MSRSELRRKDREMSDTEAVGLLTSTSVGRMGTVGPDGMPYVVPMNFVFDSQEQTIYLHCATSGHLLANVSFSPLACFEVDEPGQVIAVGPRACDTSQVYKSTICFGRARIVTEQEQKERALRLFAGKYIDRLTPERSYNPTMTTMPSTAVIAMKLDMITGKRRPAIE